MIGPCPVHDGDNQTAFNINIGINDQYVGRWFCNTKNCHEDHGGGIMGLVWSLLEKLGPITFREVIDFLEKFCDGTIDPGEIKRDYYSEMLLKSKKTNSALMTRKDVRIRLKIPAQHYLSRNFSPEILDEFDVGLCDNPKAEMYNRVVFPVYDELDDKMIGCVGRTVCGDPRKWKNQAGFNKASYLYNLGKALPFIKSSKSIIVCEGQGDVIKTYEAGAKNVVGLFGCSISDTQEFLIQRTGALTLYILSDNDDAGKLSRIKIEQKMKNLFNVKHLYTETKDVGEMSKEEIQERVLTQL